MKKKILLIAMALMLLLTLTGCSSKVAGTWSNHSVSKMTLELNEDKTFTYSDKVGISVNRYTGTYTVSGNEITLHSEQYEYIFYGYGDGPEPERTETKSSSKVFEATYVNSDGDTYILLDGYKFR